MKFSSYINPKYIFTDIKANDKEEVITEMVNRIAAEGTMYYARKEEILLNILKREREISTAMGDGIFLPHTRLKNFDDFIIGIAVLDTPIIAEIGATNKTDEVKLVFLLITDVLKNKNLLKSMSVISKIASKHPDILEKIKNEHNINNIISLLKIEDIEVEHRIVAEDVMSAEVIPVKETDTLEEVASRLILEQRTGLPVVAENGDFLGEITEKELIEFGMPDHLSLMDNLNFLTVGEPFEEYLINETTTNISDIYRKSNEDMIIDKKTPILEICFKFVHKHSNRLYVVENKKYCGAVNRYDIIKKVLHI